jgi:integrase
MRAVTSADVLEILTAIAKRGPSAAILTRQIVSAIYAHAIAHLRADNDPTVPLRRAITRPAPQHADAKDVGTIRALQGALKGYTGNRTTTIAVELMLLLFLRTAELRGAPWSELDLDAATWIIPAARMKKRRKHMVPLPAQAVALLRELRTMTGDGPLLFPNNRDPSRPMSATTVNRALEYMGFPPATFTGHDFRATASTQLHEMGFRSEVVEIQLAHAKKDKVAGAYNHALYLAERRAMLQAWADWLEGVRAEAKVTQRPKRSAPMARQRPAR